MACGGQPQPEAQPKSAPRLRRSLAPAELCISAPRTRWASRRASSIHPSLPTAGLASRSRRIRARPTVLRRARLGRRSGAPRGPHWRHRARPCPLARGARSTVSRPARPMRAWRPTSRPCLSGWRVQLGESRTSSWPRHSAMLRDFGRSMLEQQAERPPLGESHAASTRHQRL